MFMKGLIITEEEKKRIRSLYGLGTQKNVLLEYPGQEIPITMNQIMQFQTWVWKNVDKLGNPDAADPNKLYKTSLCSSPCTPYNRRVNNRIQTGAIDGSFGGNTIKLWNTHKKTYINANPSWDSDDTRMDGKVVGIEIPTTPLQIKNFQKWYLEKIEKYCDQFPDSPTFTTMGCKIGPDRNDKKFKTKLCGGERCLFKDAVDGSGIENLNSETRKLWEIYKNQYKIDNPTWFEEKNWSLAIKALEDQEEEKTKKLIKLVKLPSFWSDPSGWDGKKQRYSKNAAWEDVNNEKYWTDYEDANTHYADFAWNVLPSLYPPPRKYTLAEINSILPSGFQVDINGNTIKKGLDWQDPENMLDIAKKMVSFNTDLERQEEDILTYCTPMTGLALESKGDTDNVGKKFNRYISTDNACLYAGGSWVYNIGGMKKCQCRDRTAPYLEQTVMVGEINQIGYTSNDKSITLPKISGIFDYKAENDFHANEITDWARVINDVSPYISIPLAVFGSMIPGVGPLVIEGILLAVDLIDAAAYVVRGDMYGAGLAFTLGVIGAPKIMRRIPGVEELMLRTGLGFGKLVGKIGEAMTKGGDALRPYLEVLEQLSINGRWLRQTFNESLPPIMKKAKDYVAKVGTKVGDTLVGLAKLSYQLSKLTFEQYLEFIIWLSKTKNLPVSFLRNFGINVGGAFLAWDTIAYYLGMCNTMPLEQVEQIYKDCEELEKSNPLNLTEEDKEFLKSKPWLLTVQFAKTMSTFQALTDPCVKIESYIIMKKKMEEMAAEESKKLALGELDTVKRKVMEQLETIKSTYTPTPGFDPQLYSLQLALQHFLDNTPTEGEVEKIENWGELDRPTKVAIKLFQRYSDLEETGIIDKELVEKMLKYLNLVVGDIKNYGGLSLDNEEMTKLINEAVEEAQNKEKPTPPPIVINGGAEWDKLPNEEKQKIIDGQFKPVNITGDEFDEYKKNK